MILRPRPPLNSTTITPHGQHLPAAFHSSLHSSLHSSSHAGFYLSFHFDLDLHLLPGLPSVLPTALESAAPDRRKVQQSHGPQGHRFLTRPSPKDLCRPFHRLLHPWVGIPPRRRIFREQGMPEGREMSSLSNAVEDPMQPV
jgi:hypothetical protein